LNLRGEVLITLFSGLKFLLLFLKFLLFDLVCFLPGFEVFLAFSDNLLFLIELLEIVDLHLHVCLVDRYYFLIQIFNLCLKIFYLLVHLLDVLLSLPKVLSSLVLLLLQVLFQEAKIAASFVVDLLATAFSAS